MKELLAVVLNENEEGNFTLDFHLDKPEEQVQRTEKMLHALMQARAGMQPPVSREVPKPGQVHEAVFGSAWWIDSTLTGDVALRLHHPALGWITWALPADLARDLATKMLTMLDEQAAPPDRVQ